MNVLVISHHRQYHSVFFIFFFTFTFFNVFFCFALLFIFKIFLYIRLCAFYIITYGQTSPFFILFFFDPFPLLKSNLFLFLFFKLILFFLFFLCVFFLFLVVSSQMKEPDHFFWWCTKFKINYRSPTGGAEVHTGIQRRYKYK